MQTVSKLIALAVVVGIGVLVVIQAQRQMTTQDPADNQSQSDPSGDEDQQIASDTSDADETPPDQAEPELAWGDDDEPEPVPASAKLGSRRSSSASAAADEDDTIVARNESRKAPPKRGALSRPSEPVEEDDSFLQLRPDDASETGGTRASRPTQARDTKPLAIDDLESPDDPLADSPPARRPSRETPGESAGPALRLTDEGSDEPVAARRSRSLPNDDKPAPLKRIHNEEPDALAAEFPFPRKSRTPPPSDPLDDFDADRQKAEVTDTLGQPAEDEPAGRPLPRRSASPAARPVAEFDPLADDDAPAAAPAKRDPPLDAESETIPNERPQSRLADVPGDSDADDDQSFRRDAPEAQRSPAKRATDGFGLDSVDADAPGQPPARPSRAVGPRPRLSIKKTAPPTAVLGKPMVYQIVVRNNGPAPAHQVIVEDSIPDGVKMDGSIPQARIDKQRLFWKLGTIGPDDEKKISVRVIPQNEGTIGSVATVNYSTEQPLDASRGSNLRFAVEAPRQATLGGKVTLRFKVANSGPKTATRVVIRNVLPAALRHDDGDDLEYEVGTLPPGESREVELTLTAARLGKTVNRAVMTAEGNVTEESTVAVEVVGPSLAVSREGPKRVFPNKQATYTNRVENNGPAAVSDVHLVETIPAGMELIDAADGGRYDAPHRTVTWLFPRLGAGESKRVQITLKADERGAQVSVVRAYDSSGVSAETMGTTHVTGVPALRIEFGEIPAMAEPGEQLKIPVRVVNRGTDAATNLRATVALPVQLEFVSATAPVEHREQTVGTPTGSRRFKAHREIQFAPIDRLEPRHEATFELTVTARAMGDARLEVAVTCDQIAEPIRREDATTVARPQE
ncbi:MAG: hypothetical protein ACT4QC_08300 [Planctomycetaceae bacterium]